MGAENGNGFGNGCWVMRTGSRSGTSTGSWVLRTGTGSGTSAGCWVELKGASPRLWELARRSHAVVRSCVFKRPLKVRPVGRPRSTASIKHIYPSITSFRSGVPGPGLLIIRFATPYRPQWLSPRREDRSRPRRRAQAPWPRLLGVYGSAGARPRSKSEGVTSRSSGHGDQADQSMMSVAPSSMWMWLCGTWTWATVWRLPTSTAKMRTSMRSFT